MSQKDDDKKNLVRANLQRREDAFKAYEMAEAIKPPKDEFSTNEKKLIETLVGIDIPKAENYQSAEKDNVTDQPETNKTETKREPRGAITLFNEKGEYKLALNSDDESALQAKRILTNIGCDLSGLNRLGAAMSPAECAKQIIDLKKPQIESNIKDAAGETVERESEKTHKVVLNKREQEPSIVETAGYIVKFRTEPSSHSSGVFVEVLSRDNQVELFKKELNPGVNIFQESGKNEFVINLSDNSEEKAIVEISQKGSDVRAINNPSVNPSILGSKNTEPSQDKASFTTESMQSIQQPGIYTAVGAESAQVHFHQQEGISGSSLSSGENSATDSNMVEVTEPVEIVEPEQAYQSPVLETPVEKFDTEDDQSSEGMESYNNENNVINVDFGDKTNTEKTETPVEPDEYKQAA